MKTLKWSLLITMASSFFASPAYGQWGTGLYPGTVCPYNFAPAQQAFGGVGPVRVADIPEAGFCATCAAQSSNQQIFSAVGAIAQVTMALFMRHKARRAPYMLPYQSFQQNPYRAPLPGYYNPGPTYGTVPGGIGSGAFGCNNFGMIGGSSPWGNPYLSPYTNAQTYNGLFNSGYAPIAPVGPPATLAYRSPQFAPVTNWANYQGNIGYTPVYNYGLGVGATPLPGTNSGGAPAVLPYNNNGGTRSTTPPAVLPYLQPTQTFNPRYKLTP